MSTVLASDRDAILLLCSPLSGAKPLTLGEWASLATSVHESGVGSPGRLFEMEAESLTTRLGLGALMSERVAALLERGGPLAVELERLENRGVWVLTRADVRYPARLKERLKLKAPPVLYGVGDMSLLDQGGVAIVGSRDASDGALEATEEVASLAARERLPVVSGGARGVDQTAMHAALERQGTAVGILADSLLRAARSSDTRLHAQDGRLVLVSPYGVDVRFTAGMAMARNKLVYCLADVAVVTASASGSGGTWAGAVEALRQKWCPVVSWVGRGAGEGNRPLVERGAVGISTVPDSIDGLLSNPTAAEAAQDVSEPQDAFSAIWPLLEQALRVPRMESELAKDLDLVKSQVHVWLMRAVERGLVHQVTRTPKRFIVAQEQLPGQVALFDG